MGRPYVRLGAYQLLDRLGGGAVGEVWRARGPVGPDVAVKVVRPERSARAQRAFDVEVRVASQLHHAHIVRILDVGRVDDDSPLGTGALWFAMTLGDGGTLSHWRGHVGWSTLRTWVSGILKALAYAHGHGVLHRDLKPDNILLWTGPEGEMVPMLTDFGMSRVEESVAPSGGSRPYMPPEQLRHLVHLEGPWTDLYALACVLWEMALGAPPPAGTDLAARRRILEDAEVPEDVCAWMVRCLDPVVTRRFSSAAAARAAWDGTPLRLPNAPPPAAVFEGSWGYRQHPPMQGRAAELDVIWSALRRAMDHDTTEVVVVAGPSGSGRTRVLRELEAAARASGVVRVFRATHAREPAVGDGVRGLVAAALSIAPSQSIDRAHGAVAEVMRMWSTLDLRGAADFARLIAGPGVSERRRHALAHRMMRWRSGPYWVRLDDAGRDPGTLRFAQYLSVQAGAGLVAVVVDPSELDEECRGLLKGLEARGVRVEMGLLSDDAAERVLDLAGMTLETRAKVRARVGSHVGALMGAAHDVRHGGRLGDRPAERWRARADALWERLGWEARKALWVGAAMGAEVDERVWRRASVALDGELSQGLCGRLLDRGLAAVDGRGTARRWRFLHPAIREAWLARAPDVRMVHRACAETIVGVDPVSRTRRARHLALAGDVDGACEVFHEVLDAGWLRADVSSAASTSRQALAVAERLGLPELEAHAAIVLGWAWMRAGSVGEGAALCEQGRDRADALGRDLHAAFAEVQLGHHARFQGKDAEATRWLELAAHRLDGAALRDTATGTAVRHLLWEEQVGAAIAVADRGRVVSLLAQQMGRTRTHRERLSAVLSGAEAFVYLRDDAEMVRWLEQAEPLEHAAGPAEVRLLAYLRGQHALGLQRWDDARVAFERAVSEAEADGHTAFALGCRGRLADVLRQQGNLDEARSAFEDLLGAHQRRGSAHGATAARCNLALVALQQDREDDADVLLLEAEEGTRPESVMASFVHGLALVVAYRRGDLDGIAYELAQVAHPALVMDEDIIRDAVGEIAAAEDPAWDAVAATARGWIS